MCGFVALIFLILSMNFPRRDFTIKVCLTVVQPVSSLGVVGGAHLVFPGQRLNCAAVSNFTKPSLHLQFAGRVLVGDACGDAGATALGTGAPLGALLHTGGGGRGQFVQGVAPRERRPQPVVRSHGCRETRSNNVYGY